MQKNDQITLDCLRLGSELEGICEHQGQAVFVAGALPDETIRAHVLKVHKRYAFAKLINVIKPSPLRATPFCAVYDQCGGCSGQHMSYEATLACKRTHVIDCLTRIAGLSISEADVAPVASADTPHHCRNKTALPVGGTADAPLLGFYRKRSHSIVSIEDCPVTMGPLQDVIHSIKAWMKQARITPYDERSQRGLLRHVIMRSSRNGQVMVLLVTTSENIPCLDALIASLKRDVVGFCSLHSSLNRAHNNVILGKTSKCLYGTDTIQETLLGLTFDIAPLSFFQVNPDQTEVLYRYAIDFANLAPSDIVVDAYAGAGTIALCMAKIAKEVVGIEIVPQAVDSAIQNAKQNGITNASFHVDAVENLLPKLIADGLRPDVIMLDPPRKGVEQPVIDAVLTAKPRRIVYVSCHVPTQARDVKSLCEGGYKLTKCQPVDMFCYAGGVENVVLLEKV